MAKSKIIRIHSDELAPTQPTIGAFEVRLKADRFRLMSPQDIDGYIEAKRSDGKPVSVVKGLHRYFAIDGHHTLSAILAASGPRELHLDQVEDYSGLDAEPFWDKMKKRGFCLDRGLGKPVEPSSFSLSLSKLHDDPFRSVAWLIRKMGGFADLKIPYQEFEVADFLRTRMAFAPVYDYQYEIASLRAFELMRSSEAQEFAKKHPRSGFINEPVPNGLLERYYQVLAKARAPRYYRR